MIVEFYRVMKDPVGIFLTRIWVQQCNKPRGTADGIQERPHVVTNLLLP